jgi:hypothetical protein
MRTDHQIPHDKARVALEERIEAELRQEVLRSLDMASCKAWLNPFVITGATAVNRHWIS